MIDKTQLNSHPLNVQALKILKAAKIPWHPTSWMPVSTLMLWVLEDGERAAQVPMGQRMEEFQGQYVDLEEAVLDLDQHAPEVLLALIEDHEGEISLTEDQLEGLSPEEAGCRLLEELNCGMALHPERYQ